MRPVMPIVSIPCANTPGIAGDLGREHLVGVQRVVVAGRARVLHDLGALQVLDDDRRERLARLRAPAPTAPSQPSTALLGADADAARGDDELAVLVAVLGDRLGEHELAGAPALLLPTLARDRRRA